MKSEEKLERYVDDWLPGAMFPSEVWWLYRNILESGAEILIECGRQDGFSTRLLGEVLKGTNVHIYSIDFDEDKERLKSVKEMLSSYKVTCVSGDIHKRVPELLREHRDKRIAVVQDGPKGWEGMCTLLACIYDHKIVLCAQHNLHKGHRSREFFQLISNGPTFLEYSDNKDIIGLRNKEMTRLIDKNSNRELNHSSLGIFKLEDHNKTQVIQNIESLKTWVGVWDPAEAAKAWKGNDFGYVSNLRAKQRYSLYRFKKR